MADSRRPTRRTGRTNRSGRRTNRTKKRKPEGILGRIFAGLKACFAAVVTAVAKIYRRNPKRFLIAVAVVIIAIIVIFAASIKPGSRMSTEGYEHISDYSSYVIANGIDVSYAQGEIDWKKIKAQGVDFAIVRAGFRDIEKGNLYEDEYFRANIKGAQQAGLAVGAYIYSQATSKAEAIEEAEYVLELVKGYDIDMPIVLDYETYDGGRLDNAIEEKQLSAKQLNSIALAFCRTIEDAGYQAAVYGNYDMLMHHLDGVSLSKQTGIWTAQYNTFAEFTGYFQYWQCSESLQLDGTESKYVDRDFWYVPVGETAYTFAQNADERTSLEDCKVTLKKDSYHYLGKPVKAKIKIKNGLRTLRKGRDYNVCYINNTSKGESYAVVTGVGKYKDTISLKFTIK